MSDQIHIDSDEDGFYLEIEDLAVVRITDPEALYDQVKAAIGPWLYERDQMRREALANVALSRMGYDKSDPKSEGWHDRMSDLWDNRDKTERKPW